MGDIDIAISETGGRKRFSLTVMMNGIAVPETVSVTVPVN